MIQDIIVLETPVQLDYSYELSLMIEMAVDLNDEKLIQYIRNLWDNESWESILKKFNTEGSVWYVWFMDGVRALIHLDNQPHAG